MHTSILSPTPHTEHKVLRRVQGVILLLAAGLSLAALIYHHPGLVALVVAFAVLAQLVVERVSSVPEHASQPDTAHGYRYTDGGSFRGEDHKRRAPRKSQSFIVHDGGNHR